MVSGCTALLQSCHDRRHSRPRRRRPRRRRPRRPAAEPRLRRGRAAGRHLRHQPADPRPDRRRRDAVPRDRRRRAPARRSSPTGRLELSADGAILERTEQVVVVIGTPGRRVPRPVDDGLRAGRRPDLAAPPRRRARRPAQHRLSRARPATSPSTSRRAAARSTSPSAPSGSPRATRSRSSTRCPRSSAPTTTRPATGAEALFGRLAAKTIRTTTKEAELAKLFTNTWRYMKFAVANQFFMIADQAGVDYTNVLRRDPRRTIRGPRTCRVPASPPARACSRTRCSSRRSRPTTSRSARPRCRSTRACRRTSSSALERRYGGLHGKTVGILGHGVQGRVGRHRGRRSATSSASCSPGPAPGSLCTDPYVAATIA